MLSNNGVLAGLSRSEGARLARVVQKQYLDMKEVVFEPGHVIEHVYFPLEGMFSLVTVLKDGSSIEVASVGNEGMLEIAAFLGLDAYLWRGMSQIPGRALRMEANAFKEELARRGNLYRMMQRYTHALLLQVAQSAACNRLHSTEQRCCKWLLLTHDRVEGDEFPLTHEFLSQMLGVRRAGVTEVAGNLQRAGFIGYRRGTLRILDRRGLEAASCECYETIRKEFDRLSS